MSADATYRNEPKTYTDLTYLDTNIHRSTYAQRKRVEGKIICRRAAHASMHGVTFACIRPLLASLSTVGERARLDLTGFSLAGLSHCANGWPQGVH